MRGWVGAVMATVMLVGCETPAQTVRTGGYTMLTGAGVVGLAGVGLLAPDNGGPGSDKLGFALIAITGVAVMGVGGIIGAAGLLAMSYENANQPDPPPAVTNETPMQCHERRSAQLRAAQTIADPKRRGAALVAVTSCSPR